MLLVITILVSTFDSNIKVLGNDLQIPKGTYSFPNLVCRVPGKPLVQNLDILTSLKYGDGGKNDRKKLKLRSNRMEIFFDQRITNSSGRKKRVVSARVITRLLVQRN